MADDIEQATLAPLDALIAILPQIQKAKERDRLGDALRKATSAAERYAWIPERLKDLSTLLDATSVKEAAGANKEDLRLELGVALDAVIRLGRILAGELSIEDLVRVNQDSMRALPFHIEKIEQKVETLWRESIEQAFGGQAALGQVLSTIPGIELLGRDVTNLSARVAFLIDAKRPARDRVNERNELVIKVSAMANRLLEAGVAPSIAAFLVAVATNPVQLSEVTDEILAWIRQHEALTLFLVSTRRT
jgi:hypothetical protein